MKRTRRIRLPRGPRDSLIWLGGAGLLAGSLLGGFMVGAKRLSSERAQAEEELRTYQRAIEETAKEASARTKLDREIAAVVDRTLGSDQELADSALRSRLNRIGEEIRLMDLRVSTGTATKRATPAKRTLPKPKDPRDLDDFVELPATVSGEGTIEQALQLVHRIDVEPWIKRIDSVRLEELKQGERIKVTVRLTTLFLPDRKGRGDLKPTEGALASFERLRPIVNANPFRVPQPAKPATPVAAAQPTPPAAPSGFPYEQWRLTGVVTGPLGAEAWLKNSATGEQRQLAPGQQIGDVVFVGCDRDLAEFRQGENRFRVQVGGAMNERAPLAEHG
ncbi:MAG: hypothetical protein U0572_07355 [Phycisphaerales bacterium]